MNESSIYTAGSSENKGIGRIGKKDDLPGKIITPPGYITHLALGWKHGHCVINQKEFYSWGLGDSWRLATGNKLHLAEPTRVKTFPENFIFDMLVAGDKFGAALNTQGQIYVWGSGYSHTPTKQSMINIPAVYISASQKTLVAALENGQAVTVLRKNQPSFIQIPNETITLVAAGSDNFICVCKSGHAFSWTESSSPVFLELSQSPMIRCFAYHNNYYFISDDNKIYCYGGNEDGSLGAGRNGRVVSPILMTDTPFVSPIVQIAIGDDFALALTSDGTVYGAGNAENNRTMISRLNRTTHTKFIECDLLKEYHVTQIAAGCFTSAVLVNGAPPPHLDPPYKSLSEVPTPETMSMMMVADNSSVLVGPNPEVFTKLGIKPGDILKKGDYRYKVLGISEGNDVVVANNDLKIVFLKSDNFVEEFFLEIRNNSRIESHNTVDGRTIVVDLSLADLMELGGYKPNDMLWDGSKIIGTRGNRLFALNKDGFLTEVSNSTVEKVIRNGVEIFQHKFINGKSYIVEPTNETKNVYCCNEFGAGVVFGNVGDKMCIQYASLFGLLKICDEDIFTCRKHQTILNSAGKQNSNSSNEEKDCGLIEKKTFYDEFMTKVEVFIDNEEINGILPFDLVNTPRGLGTVAGFLESTNRVAVFLENCKSNYGTVSLFNSDEIHSCGRFFTSLIVENGISANTDDLVAFKLIPYDEVQYKDIRWFVKGFRNGKLVLEDEKKNGIEINGEEAQNEIIILRRHMMATCEQALEGTALFCSKEKNSTIPKI
ncbi:hypothetical protein TRFO_18124 [Tritrichomonas foetus]|uniref:Uncharacterized protein n=1 Tax=Tritrichomonas foetus TaxID=1144522 RepID=A0A1J4KLW8_9EUKA|nr:hypothetical protein TRFO_18124 [Tritrichomonas foetus]|eukprot:OHT12211.1 hypothetical protein TRFO_18124 [Tritrichomonas foetus]